MQFGITILVRYNEFKIISFSSYIAFRTIINHFMLIETQCSV